MLNPTTQLASKWRAPRAPNYNRPKCFVKRALNISIKIINPPAPTPTCYFGAKDPSLSPFSPPFPIPCRRSERDERSHKHTHWTSRDSGREFMLGALLPRAWNSAGRNDAQVCTSISLYDFSIDLAFQLFFETRRRNFKSLGIRNQCLSTELRF